VKEKRKLKTGAANRLVFAPKDCFFFAYSTLQSRTGWRTNHAFDLPNAYLRNDDAATALNTVDEAIQVAIERHARIPKCLARIVRADVLLLSSDSEQRAEGRRKLETQSAHAREWRHAFQEVCQHQRPRPEQPRQISTKRAEQIEPGRNGSRT
jgi:hypothetical protein